MKPLEILCKELGVEVGESWKADGVHEYPKTYGILDNTLWIWVQYEEEGIGHCGEWVEASMADYVAFIKGELRPIWKPKLGTTYYIPDIFVKGLCIAERWDNLDKDYMYLKRGLVFETEEDAVIMANQILDFIKEERDNE